MRGANILKNSLNKARNTIKRPNWLAKDVWDNLCQHWRSKPFKVKSLVTKVNRASNCQGFGVSLHTVGSISISHHKENLENFYSDLCTFEILLHHPCTIIVHKYYFNFLVV